MSDVWYIQRDGQTFGPFNAAQMRAMTGTGQLLPVDLVARGDGGEWVPASQIKGLFATPMQVTAVPPPLPVADSPSSPVDAFAFDGGPVQDDEGAGTRASRRKRPSPRLSKSLLAAIAGGLVVVIGVAIYFTTRGGSNNTTVAGAQAGTDGKGRPKGGSGNNKRGPENRKPGKMYFDDLAAKMGPPSRSYAKIDDSTIADYSLHVWDAGGGFYDLVFTALPTKTNEPEFIQGTQSDVNKTRLDAILKGYRPK